MQKFPLSPSTGLAAPHPLTERRKRRAQRNTSETGERVTADILKASSAATVTAMGVGERCSQSLLPGGRKKDKEINGEREIKCGKNV